MDILRKQEEIGLQWRNKLESENTDIKRQIESLKATLMSNKISATIHNALALSANVEERGDSPNLK